MRAINALAPIRRRAQLRGFIFCFALPAALLVSLQVRGQGYTLEQCQQKAQANYPQVRQLELIEQTGEYNLNNASKGYLPQFSLSAKATWQTQVIEFPDIPIPGLVLPKQNNDQYQAAVQLNQVLWDGGQIGAAKEGIRSATEVQKQQYQVDMYALRSRVNDLFFAILLLDGQIEVNRTNLATLDRNYADVESYMKNGVANQADVDAIHVEQLALQQANIQLATAREAYGRVLFTFIGEPYHSDFTLVTPPLTGAPAIAVMAGAAPSPDLSTFERRPEMALFDAMAAQQTAQLKDIRSHNMPRLSLFVQGAYGNPGLNLFKTGWTPYAIGGVQLSWNFGNLYSTRNERRTVENNLRMIDIRRETFLFNTNQQAIGQNLALQKYLKLMESDQQIIDLRESIREATEAKVKFGTATGSDLMRETDLERVAHMNKVLHNIQGLQSLYELKNTTNNQ